MPRQIHPNLPERWTILSPTHEEGEERMELFRGTVIKYLNEEYGERLNGRNRTFYIVDSNRVICNIRASIGYVSLTLEEFIRLTNMSGGNEEVSQFSQFIDKLNNK